MRCLSILLFSISIAWATIATAEQQQVHCPTVDALYQVADTEIKAALVSGSYIAATMPFSIHTQNNIGWFAVVYGIKATSEPAAIELAKTILRGITVRPEYARNLGGTYVCDYEYGRVQVLSNDDQNGGNTNNKKPS